MKNKKWAFTLIELIVTITILSILWIIAFLNYKDYSKDSRNSVRLNDISNIKKVLELFYLNSSFYPDPDETINVTYSGGLLWKQWYFNEWMISKVHRLSKPPKDPLIDVPYTYSLFNKASKYQIWSVLESKSAISAISQTYAYTNENVLAYVVWNFDLYDIHFNTGSTCLNVSTPSMIINDLPLDGVLNQSASYNFVYNNWYNLPNNYESRMEMVTSWFPFTLFNVYNKCSVEALSDINNYIVNLSVAYTQFNGVADYTEVANNSRTLNFIKKSIWYLQANGLTVSKDLILMLDNAYIDTFLWNDADNLVGNHYSNTLWTWEFMSPSSNTGSYIIAWNTLQKTGVDADIITPVLLKPKTSKDSTIFLKVVDFNGGNVVLYLRYLDIDNYYSVTVNTSGYAINIRAGGVTSSFPISWPISNNSIVQFSVTGDTIKFIVNWNELESRIDTSINAIWKDAIYLSSGGVKVDDFTLYFN